MTTPKTPKILKRETLKKYKAIASSHAVEAYIRVCLDEEDRLEDEINYCISAELAVLKSLQFIFHVSYYQLDSNQEGMFHEGTYIAVFLERLVGYYQWCTAWCC